MNSGVTRGRWSILSRLFESGFWKSLMESACWQGNYKLPRPTTVTFLNRTTLPPKPHGPPVNGTLFKCNPKVWYSKQTLRCQFLNFIRCIKKDFHATVLSCDSTDMIPQVNKNCIGKVSGTIVLPYDNDDVLFQVNKTWMRNRERGLCTVGTALNPTSRVLDFDSYQ